MKGIVDVSVIIPAYNVEKYIEDCLRSVLSQTVKPKEIIVVNDGSSDTTLALVKQYENEYDNIRCISKQNAGLSDARNSGIRVATSKYIAFLDSDDLWHPTKLAKQLDLFDDDNLELGLVYSAYELCDQNSQPTTGIIIDPCIKGDALEHLIEKGNLISGSGSGVLIKRSVFEDVGEFDISLRYAEDLDMWIRIAEKYHVDFVDEVLVIIRTHSDSMQAQYTSHYTKFLANWPLYSKHSGYFTRKDMLKNLRFNAVNAALESTLRGVHYQKMTPIRHIKMLMLGKNRFFNSSFTLYIVLMKCLARRVANKLHVIREMYFAKN
ncbi:glycosyltransferase family 2 protein [Vibrio cionasavignyae]|uniref:glycosyltransferase family 2 protein n=1 Tax=Vibrio cionasavignyae TaxID=2910252 RepID=UPI003D0ED95B